MNRVHLIVDFLLRSLFGFILNLLVTHLFRNILDHLSSLYSHRRLIEVDSFLLPPVLVVLADFHGLELEHEGSPESVEGVEEERLVDIKEFLLHPVQVVNLEGHHFRLLEGHDCELTEKDVFMGHPVVQVKLILEH